MLPRAVSRVPNMMKRACAVTILAQTAKQDTLFSHSKQVACDKVLGQNSWPARRVAARIGAGRVARLGNRTTIARIERLAITNSGCNAYVFHHVRHSEGAKAC